MRRIAAGEVVIRFGGSDHWRGRVLERIPGRRLYVQWQDYTRALEWEDALLRVVGAPDPCPGERAAARKAAGVED